MADPNWIHLPLDSQVAAFLEDQGQLLLLHAKSVDGAIVADCPRSIQDVVDQVEKQANRLRAWARKAREQMDAAGLDREEIDRIYALGIDVTDARQTP